MNNADKVILWLALEGLTLTAHQDGRLRVQGDPARFEHWRQKLLEYKPALVRRLRQKLHPCDAAAITARMLVSGASGRAIDAQHRRCRRDASLVRVFIEDWQPPQTEGAQP